MTQFSSMGLPEALTNRLTTIGFTEPTPIQSQAIPVALTGKDILGSAQTGTGKTAAFGIPLLAKLLTSDTGSALVLTPTRELAMQVMDALRTMLGEQTQIKTAILIGGAPIQKQLRQLKKNPRIVVGTPGRVNDHLNRGTLSLSATDFLVLDETDRMLDMGFSVQIDAIVEHMPTKRQTLLFSATLPKNILRVADQYLYEPTRIAVSKTTSPTANIKQHMLRVKEADKYDQLLSELKARSGSIIVFVKTKHGSERMAKRIASVGHLSSAIHGDLKQSKRSRIIRDFRQEKYRILVATDVAARGLDIPHIEHVINYDLPQCPEDYIHRIGRTARAGAEGEAMSLVSPSDNKCWHAIDCLINPGKASKDAMKPQSGKKKKPFRAKKQQQKRRRVAQTT